MSFGKKITAVIAGTILASQLASAGISAECNKDEHRYNRTISIEPYTALNLEQALKIYCEEDTVKFAYSNFDSGDANLVLQYLDKINDIASPYLDQPYFDGHLNSYSDDEKKELLEKLNSVPIKERMEYNRSYRQLNPVKTDNGNLLEPVLFGAIGTMEEIKRKNTSSLDAVLDLISKKDIIFFGVDHYDESAHEEIGVMIQKLAEKGHKINLFMECFYANQNFLTTADKLIVDKVKEANRKKQSIRIIDLPLHDIKEKNKFYHLADRYDLYEIDSRMADCVQGNYDEKKINILVTGMAHTIFDSRMPSKIYERIGSKKTARIIFSWKRAVDAHYAMKKKLSEGYFKNPSNPLGLDEDGVRRGYGIGDTVMLERVRKSIDFYFDNRFHRIKQNGKMD